MLAQARRTVSSVELVASVAEAELEASVGLSTDEVQRQACSEERWEKKAEKQD